MGGAGRLESGGKWAAEGNGREERLRNARLRQAQKDICCF